MHRMKTLFVGAVVAVTVLSAGAAQATPGADKEQSRGPGQSVAPDRAGGEPAAPAPGTAALTTIQRRIAGYVAAHGTGYTFASYLDPTTGGVVMHTDAPADVVSSLTKLSAAEEPAPVRVRPGRINDTSSQFDDIPPFWGAAAIDSGSAQCTAGYAAQNGVGTRFMVTAGHCFPAGATVETASHARVYGGVVARNVTNRDVELLGGQPYAGRIYTGLNTSAPVVGAGSAAVGFSNYCYSGRVSGEQCGLTAISTTAQVCTPTGCKSPVIAASCAVTLKAGDSGAPFYAKDSNGGIWIRGHAIASGGNVCYFEPWTVVAAMFGLGIVTG